MTNSRRHFPFTTRPIVEQRLIPGILLFHHPTWE